MWRVTGIAIVTFALMSVSMRSQGLGVPEGLDLSGSWVARNFTDALGNPPAMEPTPVDFLGIPLSEAGRAAALSTSPSQISMPERMCDFYPPTYIVLGPAGLKIWPESELRTGATTAWIVSGWTAYAPFPIFMDGRPHPSKYAPHPKTGFTTGTWVDDVLTTSTTHMEVGILRRNLAPSSDLATMTTRFSRHGDILTVTARIDDPVNLTEPFYLTRTFVLGKTPLNPASWPCTVGDEGVPKGVVPHYLPGQNPFLDEVTRLYGIPVEAVLGGSETMYPEFRRKIREKYVRPEPCVAQPGNRAGFCGSPGLYPPVN